VLLSPRDLAAALGISESSLKRWIDAGRIRATRTEGGHRRITLADARAFIRETGAPVLHPELLGLPDDTALEPASKPPKPRTSDAALQRALVTGDTIALRAWVRARVASGASIATICDGPIRSAMYAIGELWQHDPDGVFIEHRATDLCLQALNQLRATVDAPANAPVALGAAPEDDPYLLPSAMAALVLGTEGYRSVNLGADTPTAALHRAIAHYRPRIVWISASAPIAVAQAHEVAAFLGGLAPPAIGIVGGRQRATILDADRSLRSVGSMVELAALARSLR
jgi:excisionase family DNA binding protein